LITTGAIFAAGLAVQATGASVPRWATVATSPLLIEFYLGAIIYFLFVARFVLPTTLAWLALILGFAVILLVGDPVGGDWIAVLYWGLPCAVILAGAVLLERAAIGVPKTLIALGASSYSVYLTHPFVVAALAKAWALLQLSERWLPCAGGCSLARFQRHPSRHLMIVWHDAS
jgi:peptidoglycan/LPS O-acetylase OafA/YrhL